MDLWVNFRLQQEVSLMGGWTMHWFRKPAMCHWGHFIAILLCPFSRMIAIGFSLETAWCAYILNGLTGCVPPLHGVFRTLPLPFSLAPFHSTAQTTAPGLHGWSLCFAAPCFHFPSLPSPCTIYRVPPPPFSFLLYPPSSVHLLPTYWRSLLGLLRAETSLFTVAPLLTMPAGPREWCYVQCWDSERIALS